ncbi:MAG: GDSL-type esterase/lipase family protein [Myxococcota bacterium]
MPRRRLFFWLVTLALPLALFTVAEAIVRLTLSDTVGDDAYLNLVDVPSFFATRRVDGRRYYQVSHPEAYRGRKILFPVQKSPGSVRIFALGGSASAGWPHPPGEIYTAYLKRALEQAYPDRDFEVINVSAHAYAAYRVRLIFDNVIRFEPDLVVLYSGNNEFLERRSYLARSRALAGAVSWANHSALFRLLRSQLVSQLFPENSLSAKQREDAREGVAAKLRQQAVELRRDPEQFARLMDHYAYSVRSMVEDARAAGVPVVLATVPVNLRDWRPNASHNQLAGAARDRWRQTFDEGRAALLRGDSEGAVRAFEQALALEPEHAESWFLVGRARELQGAPDRAFEAYGRARDLDHNPFRALSEQNAILRRIAAEEEGVTLVDLEAAFNGSAAAGAGFDLFLDYVHPTRDGNLLVARTVFETLLESKIFGSPTGEIGFPSAPHDPQAYDEDRDPRLQTTRFALMAVMHQYQGMVDQARRLRAAGVTLPMAQEVLEVFPPYLELERRRLLALPVDPAEARRIEAAYRRFYSDGGAGGGSLR